MFKAVQSSYIHTYTHTYIRKSLFTDVHNQSSVSYTHLQAPGSQGNTMNSQPINGNPEVRQETQTGQQPNVPGDRANETVAHLN